MKKQTWKQKEAEMVAYLRRNPEVKMPSGKVVSAVELALVRIYQRQTSDEQQCDETRHDNNRGFQQRDAKWGSKMARVVLSGGRLFTHNQDRALRMAIRYRRQLIALRDARQAKKGVTGDPVA